MPLTTAVELEGKVAVVTGAAMGIGFAVAEALVDAGAQVVLADLEPESGKQAAADVGGLSLERETGFGPATSSLARKRSTTELLPHLPAGGGREESRTPTPCGTGS